MKGEVNLEYILVGFIYAYTQTRYPRFQQENLVKNKVFFERIAGLASKHGCTPGQLALAWLLHQGDDVVPIPGKNNA